MCFGEIFLIDSVGWSVIGSDDHFLLLRELECARKKFNVSAGGNVCKFQVVLDDNEHAPVCIRLAVVPINVITKRRIKNVEELLKYNCSAMITSGEVVSIKTSFADTLAIHSDDTLYFGRMYWWFAVGLPSVEVVEWSLNKMLG